MAIGSALSTLESSRFMGLRVCGGDDVVYFPRNPTSKLSYRCRLLPREICTPQSIFHYAGISVESKPCTKASKSFIVGKSFFGLSKEESVSCGSIKSHSLPLGTLLTSKTPDVSTSQLLGEDRIGVLLLNLGGPETLEDVQPFLYNLFADPDIIRLPRLFRFLQKPLARFISVARAPKSKEGYASIGGGSPLRQITDAQAEELRKALCEKNVPAKVYVGMRYWHPFTEEAIEEIKRDGIAKLVVLPLYPQFSISTSGSSLRLLESIFREDEYLVNMQHTVIPSWYQREGYIKAMGDLIEKELKKFNRPEEVVIFFSAHGVPLAYVEEAGDPYKAEMEECVDLIMAELEKRNIRNAFTLAYQSRVGPVEWLKPYTDDTIIDLGKKGVKSLLAVPISFVSEHIETLEEIDVEYKELALESGIENWGRVPALGCEPTFISDLADAVIESLPYVGAMAVSNLEARQSLVPLGSVEELLAAYDSQRRELPPLVTVWEWGWTKSAETWNGRAAMLAVLVLLVLEVTTGEGFLHQWGILPLFRGTVALESLLQLPGSGFSLNRSIRGRVLHVNSFGAVGDGLHDDTEAFRSAWELACSLSQRSLIVVPKGFTYLVRPTDFAGCKSQVTLRILGAVVAPRDPEVWVGLNPRKWLYFHGVDHLTLEGGGTINGMGEEWWASSCKVNKTILCHHAPTAITFHRCRGLKVKDIRVINGQQTHVSFTNCVGIIVSNVTITAPSESPNTDGIHISASTNVEVRDTVIGTGDDCVSIVSNSSRILLTAVFCGPGHGIREVLGLHRGLHSKMYGWRMSQIQ